MNRHRKTYSKKMVKAILIISMVDLQLSYILALLGREQIAETLSTTIVTEIIAVVFVYSLKSLFETKFAEDVRLKEKEMNTDED